MKNTFNILQPQNYDLKPSRIDLWKYPLHTEFKGAKQLLNASECLRAERYYFDKHRRRFIVAHSMLRLILARYVNLSPAELIFSENHYGKPSLVNNLGLQFNLSHSKNLALLAIGHNQKIGVDLEYVAARPYAGIAANAFSNTENQALQQTHPAMQPLVFFNIWSQKEALIKACGLGLSYPTQKFDVPHTLSSQQPIIDTLHNCVWQMLSFMPDTLCCGALCYQYPIEEIRYFDLSTHTPGVL